MSDADNKNKGTLMWVPDDPRASVPEAAGLFARAAAFLPHSPRFGAAHGYRIFWLERGELRFRDVVADPRGFAIMGRHSRAHVQLAHDETIALRHFVLRAQRSDAGVSSLEVADLLAPLPLDALLVVLLPLVIQLGTPRVPTQARRVGYIQGIKCA